MTQPRIQFGRQRTGEGYGMDRKLVTVEDIGALRAHLRANAPYRLEFLAAVVRVLREYGVDIADPVLEGLTLADDAALDLMRGPDVKGLRAK